MFNKSILKNSTEINYYTTCFFYELYGTKNMVTENVSDVCIAYCLDNVSKDKNVIFIACSDTSLTHRILCRVLLVMSNV